MKEARERGTDAYMIEKVSGYELELPKNEQAQPKFVHQDLDKTYISKCFARLKRYKKEPQQLAIQNVIYEGMNFLIPPGPDVHIYKDKYLVIYTSRIVHVLEWAVRGEAVSYEPALLERKFDEDIVCLDIFEGYPNPDADPAELPNHHPNLNIAIVTRNQNNVYKLYRNSECEEINDNIYGVTFMDDGTLVLHLDLEVILYPYEGGRQFDNRKQIEKKSKESTIRAGNIEMTLTRSYKRRIFAAYVVSKGESEPNNLVLDSFMIENKELKEYKQHVLERYDVTDGKTPDIGIVDMMIVENEDQLSVLLMLKKQVLVVKMRAEPKIECPYEWSTDQNIYMLNPRQLNPSAGIEDLLLLVRYSNLLNDTSKDKQTSPGKLILLNVKSYDNYIKQEFETSLRDIITINEDDKGCRRLLPCCIIGGKIVFIFYKNKVESRPIHEGRYGQQINNDEQSDSLMVQMFHTTSIEPFEKLKKLLPDKLVRRNENHNSEPNMEVAMMNEKVRHTDTYIPKADLKMLLILNETYKTNNESSKNLYMCVWENIKQLIRSSENDDPSYLEGYTGYLYKTGDLEYVGEQLKEMIEKGVKVDPFLKKHFLAVKKMAKEKLEMGEKQGNFQMYLKATFYIKKLYLLENQTGKIQANDYNNWKRKDIRVSFLDDIRSRDKAKVYRFIQLFKTYFVWNYDTIIEDLMAKDPTKTHSGILEYYKDMLPLLLPRHIDDQHKFEISGVHEETCFDDLKFDASKDKSELMRYRKIMEERYMRNNDFLFVMRKDVIEKERQLVDQNQAIYTFLSIINRRDMKQEQKFIHSLYDSKFINLTLKMKLLLYVKLYELYKSQINSTLSLKAFLAIDVAQIFCNIIFNQRDRTLSKADINYLLRNVAAVWDPINDELDEQILKEEQTDLNRVNIEQTYVFESYLRQSFQLAHEKDGYNDMEILEKCKIFLEVISQLQSEHFEKQLLIEKVIVIVFEYLRTDYVETIRQLYHLFQSIDITEEFAQHLFCSLKIVHENIKFFQDFRLAKTIAELENRAENDERLIINKRIIEEILHNYLKAQPPMTEVTFKGRTFFVNRLKNMLELLIDFASEFYRSQGSDESMAIFELFVEIMIRAELEQPHKFDLLEELRALAFEDGIRDRDKVFFRIIKNAIKDAKAMQAEKKPAAVVADKKEASKSKPPLPPLERLTSLDKLPKDSKSQSSAAEAPRQSQSSIQDLFKTKQDSIKESKDSQPKSVRQIIQLKPVLQQKLGKEAKSLKDKPLDNSADQNRRDDISHFISKCLQVLKCSKDMDPFVKQEKLILKLQQGGYEVHQLERLKEEKILVMNEINTENRRNRPRKVHQQFEFGGHQVTSVDNVLNYDGQTKLKQLFDQSVSRKCDEYVSNNIKGTTSREDADKIVHELGNAAELFEPLFFFLKLLENSNLDKHIETFVKIIGKGDPKDKDSKDKDKERKALKQLYLIRCGLIKEFVELGSSVRNICRFVDEKWSILMAENPPSEGEGADIEINSQCDIEMYFYVQNYLKQARYFAFVQLLYRDFERAAKFYLRYRADKRLNFDVNSICSLVKIFLKHNKTNLIKHLRVVIQMLANVTWGNFEIFRATDLATIKKDMPKPTDKNLKKIIDNLDYFFDLYSHYSRESIQHEKNVATMKINPQGEKAKPNGEFTQIQKPPERQYQNEDPPLTQTHEFLEYTQRLFNTHQTKSFIEVVQRSLQKNETLQAQLSAGPDKTNHFSMYYFRLFVRCVKFDDKLIKYFPFDIFRESKLEYFHEVKQRNSSDKNLREVFHKHLRENIKAGINESNYIQIAKAIRFGFNNFVDLELEIILIYLEKMVKEHRAEMERNRDNSDFNESMEEYRLQRKIKSVLDNIDTAVLKDDRDRKRRQQFVKAGVHEKQLDAILQSY